MVLHVFNAVVSHPLGGNGTVILELLLISSNTHIDIHADIHIYILICMRIIIIIMSIIIMRIIIMIMRIIIIHHPSFVIHHP